MQPAQSICGRAGYCSGMSAPGHPIVVMGVSGSGKSTVGAALAGRLRVPFEDADDLHPQANIDKMTRGEPLDDQRPLAVARADRRVAVARTRTAA